MLNNAQWAELRQEFLAEAEELIQRAEDSLVRLQEDGDDTEAVNELFRAAHTLKGSAGILNLDSIVAFTHEFENVLMRVRDREIVVDTTIIQLSLRCVDRIAALLEPLQNGSVEDDEDPERTADLQAALREYLPDARPEDKPVDDSTQATVKASGRWHLSLRFSPDLFLHGFDPASFLKYLQRLGKLEQVVLIDDELPVSRDNYQPERCYLGVEVSLCSAATREEIESVFEFIQDLATIRILSPLAGVEDYLELIQALPEGDMRLGEILVRVGQLTQAQLDEHLRLQEELKEPERLPLGAQLIAAEAVSAPIVEAALDKQRKGREKRPGENAFLRVSAKKMDELINQVGELVIAAAGARLKTRQDTDPALNQSLEDIHQHVERIREAALQLRMVEIGESFNRFHRVVRDTADGLGKHIRLTISGADTELDKTLVDRIHEPLVHLVRNAIDHGIEMAEQRRQAGKAEQGIVHLNAYHEAGMIVIEVGDDGRGIDPEQIRRKAIHQGLIDADEEPEEQQLLQMIFHPGFSTASSVTNLSGRGVGMDSVRRNIDALRGSLEIENHPGRGCCMRIRLPLTLAIIDGFLVSAGRQYFVVPLDAVQECIESGDLRGRELRTGYRELRGHALPYLDLHRTFELPSRTTNRQSLLVVGHGRESAGVLVDQLHGEIQTVIKPLGPLFEHLPGLSGATILGSGDVALILDVPGLLRITQSPEVVNSYPAHHLKNDSTLNTRSIQI